MLLEAAAVFAVIFTAAYLYATRNFKYWVKRGIPSIKPLPFAGNVKDLFLLKMSSGEFLTDIYRKMPEKPYIGFFIFDQPALLLRDPAIIKKVLVKDFNYFSDRYIKSDVHNDPLGSKNLFITKGQTWKYLRTKLTPTFTSGRMKKMFHLLVECDTQLVDHLDKLVDEDPHRTINVTELAAKCTTDVISTYAFGIKTNSLQDPKAEFREFGKKFFEHTIPRSLEIVTFFFAPTLAKLAHLRFFQKDTNNFLRKVFWDVIDLRERSGTKRNDLIDQLIELKNKGSIEVEEKDKCDVESLDNEDQYSNAAEKFDFSADDLVAQAAIFFVAGFETSASAMSFTLYELAVNPGVQQRLRQEIADALRKNDGQITYEMVVGLKYLDMVMSETLRKFPNLPFLDRVALADYYDADSGLLIEKGTPVYIPFHALHRDPKNFPEPQKFDPERFSDEGKKKQIPFTYLPFGEGPRRCIGMRFGLLTAKAGVVFVLSAYEVEPCKDTPIPPILSTRGLVVSVDDGIPLRFKKSNLVFS